jgi:hypothetical protein
MEKFRTEAGIHDKAKIILSPKDRPVLDIKKPCVNPGLYMSEHVALGRKYSVYQRAGT